MDLIDRQAAIDAVVAWTVEDRPDIEMPTDLVGRIKALPSAQPERDAGYSDGFTDGYKAGQKDAQSEQQWIPCSDKLPEEYGEYRITWTTSASKSRFIGDSEYEITGEWDSENYRFKGEWLLPDYIKAYPSVKVLAWHELEEPWRGEEK